MEPRKRGPHLIRYKSADHQLEPSLITKRCLTSNKSAPPALPDSLPPKLTDPPMLEEPQDQSLPSPPTAKLSAADKFAVLRFLLERQKQRESLMVLESKSDESEKADDSGVMVTSIDFQDVEEIQTGSDHNGLIGSLSCPNGFSPADNCPAEPDVFTEASVEVNWLFKFNC